MGVHLTVVKPVRELDHGEVRGNAQGVGGVAARIEHLLPPARTLAKAVASGSPLFSASLHDLLERSQIMSRITLHVAMLLLGSRLAVCITWTCTNRAPAQ